jgi:hypothetical protein
MKNNPNENKTSQNNLLVNKSNPDNDKSFSKSTNHLAVVSNNGYRVALTTLPENFFENLLLLEMELEDEFALEKLIELVKQYSIAIEYYLQYDPRKAKAYQNRMEYLLTNKDTLAKLKKQKEKEKNINEDNNDKNLNIEKEKENERKKRFQKMKSELNINTDYIKLKQDEINGEDFSKKATLVLSSNNKNEEQISIKDVIKGDLQKQSQSWKEKFKNKKKRLKINSKPNIQGLKSRYFGGSIGSKLDLRLTVSPQFYSANLTKSDNLNIEALKVSKFKSSDLNNEIKEENIIEEESDEKAKESQELINQIKIEDIKEDEEKKEEKKNDNDNEKDKEIEEKKEEKKIEENKEEKSEDKKEEKVDDKKEEEKVDDKKEEEKGEEKKEEEKVENKKEGEKVEEKKEEKVEEKKEGEKVEDKKEGEKVEEKKEEKIEDKKEGEKVEEKKEENEIIIEEKKQEEEGAKQKDKNEIIMEEPPEKQENKDDNIEQINIDKINESNSYALEDNKITLEYNPSEAETRLSNLLANSESMNNELEKEILEKISPDEEIKKSIESQIESLQNIISNLNMKMPSQNEIDNEEEEESELSNSNKNLIKVKNNNTNSIIEKIPAKFQETYSYVEDLIHTYMKEFNLFFYKDIFEQFSSSLLELYEMKYKKYIEIRNEYHDQIKENEYSMENEDNLTEQKKEEYQQTIESLKEEQQHQIDVVEDEFNKKIMDKISEFKLNSFKHNSGIQLLEEKVKLDIYSLINQAFYN